MDDVTGKVAGVFLKAFNAGSIVEGERPNHTEIEIQVVKATVSTYGCKRDLLIRIFAISLLGAYGITRSTGIRSEK